MKRFVVITLLLFVGVPSHTFSQTINATLGGTVSDASGALIPGVMISATNLATGIVTTNVTNEAGAYNFASIQSGTYKVSAELPGFQTQTYNNVVLGVSQQVRLNFILQIGSVAPVFNEFRGGLRRSHYQVAGSYPEFLTGFGLVDSTVGPVCSRGLQPAFRSRTLCSLRERAAG